DWSVRYAIANSCGHILRKQALKQLDELLTKNLQGTQNRNKQYEFKKKYVEALGTIAIPESLDILVKMLGKEYQKYGNDAKDLIVQIIYSMGELGTIKAIAPLQQITLEHSPYSQSMKNSAHHALEKIAKNNGYSSKRQMLEKISQE
ncbi:MAG: HEAT repeat domain-containing protein, partial [Asgard group archaeon]|nr:HEAT repeat domain-containing protein [Asgard group archaeon]